MGTTSSGSSTSRCSSGTRTSGGWILCTTRSPLRRETSTATRRSGGAAHTTSRSPDGEVNRSEEHTSELQSHSEIVCRLPLEKKNEVNRHTILDGIITTMMATIHRINIIGSRAGSRNRTNLKANKKGRKLRNAIKNNISTNRN